MLHPTLINAHTPWSRFKSKRSNNNENHECIPSVISEPYAIPEESPLKIISLNLAFFPFTSGAPQMLYDFISIEPVHIFIFQEVKDINLLKSVFEYINSELYSQDYVLKFSSHSHNRSKLCIAFRKGSIDYISHKSVFTNLFKKVPHMLRPPDHLLFNYRGNKFSLINLHSVPYRAHSSHSKRGKFLYLLDYIKQTLTDGRILIFGGDWNFHPSGLLHFFKGSGYVFPDPAFKNQIDYFVTCCKVDHLYPNYFIDQSSFSSLEIKCKTFKDWKKILSDHFPVRYTFEFL